MVSRRGFLGVLATLPFVKDMPFVTPDEPVYIDTENTGLYDYQREIIAMAEQNEHYAFLPEKWAAESLAILEMNLVSANLVAKDLGYPDDCRISRRRLLP